MYMIIYIYLTTFKTKGKKSTVEKHLLKQNDKIHFTGKNNKFYIILSDMLQTLEVQIYSKTHCKVGYNNIFNELSVSPVFLLACEVT